MRTDRDLVLEPPLKQPPVGESFIDPMFGTVIRRITDAAKAGAAFCQVRYATVSPVNADNSLILIEYGGRPALHDASGQFLENLPSMFEPSWSSSRPELLFHCRENALVGYDVKALKERIIQRFSEYIPVDSLGRYGLRSMGEGDILDDRWALAGTRPDGSQDIFLCDAKTGKRGKVLNTTAGFNNIYATPAGNVLVQWDKPGAERFNGIEMFTSDMEFLRQVAPTGGHMDVGRLADGSDVLIRATNNDNVAGVGLISLAFTFRRQLLTTDWSLATQTFCPDVPGWAIVSAYRPDAKQSWAPYTNEILYVKMDGTRVQRLCHHRSHWNGNESDNYNWTPRATGSRDGSKVLFNSNWGRSDPFYSDVYMIDLAPAKPSQTLPQALPGTWSPISTSGLKEGQEWIWYFKLVNGQIVFLGSYDRKDI